MFCPACGNPSDDNAKFCKKCGSPIGEPPAEYVAPKQKKKFRWGRFLLGVLGALALAIGLLIYKSTRDQDAINKIRAALVISLDSAVTMPRESGALATVDSVAAHIAEMNSAVSGYIDESEGASPLRAKDCVGLFKTSDAKYGFSNRCKYPVEMAFCTNGAKTGSPGWAFQCEGDQPGRFVLGAEGLAVVMDLTGAQKVSIAACNASEAGPDRMWTQTVAIPYACARRTKLHAEPVGTGAANIVSAPNSVDRLAQCSALAEGRKLVGTERAVLIDACMREASVEGSAFNETETPKQ